MGPLRRVQIDGEHRTQLVVDEPEWNGEGRLSVGARQERPGVLENPNRNLRDHHLLLGPLGCRDEEHQNHRECQETSENDFAHASPHNLLARTMVREKAPTANPYHLFIILYHSIFFATKKPSN